VSAAAFIGAYFAKKYLLPHPLAGLTTDPNYYVILLMVIIIWYVTFDLAGLYASHRKRSLGQIIWNMVKAVSASMLILILCLYLMKITDVSRLLLAVFYLLNISLLSLSKGTIHALLRRYRRKGYNFRNILVVGSKERAKEVIQHIRENPGSGFRILGCLDLDEKDVGREVTNGVKVTGTVSQLEKLLWDKVVDELIFAMPLRKVENAEKYIALAEELGISVRIIPDWQIHKLRYSPIIASIQFEEFLGFPTMALVTTPIRRGELLIKSAFDLLFAALIVLLFLPLFLIVSMAIKLSSKGPVFFKQERCGLNGRRFMIYKFRTMVADAEARRSELETLNETDGPVFKIRNDPRIIPYLGTFLRKTGLDELPQLINVLKGEMSLVGPRPPIPSEVERYDVWQRRRLSMKPGLTCLWQTSPGRNDITFEEWMNLDLRYIDTWSLGLDFKILLRTARAVLLGEGR
jgi:exopolysaccharide biosynthesis polyprenyl glycosylphosphotransferase